MARTVSEIQQTITDTYVANMSAAGYTVDPTLWSATNVQRLLIYVVAFCTYVLETLFDVLQTDVNDAVAALKPHTLRWYATMAKAFQYGFPLLPDDDQFDNTSYTDQQIEDSKIVDYAAVVEQPNAYGALNLRMKLAHDNGTDLEPLDAAELIAFREYINEVKDAGVPVQVDSLQPDSIRQTWNIYYNPLILKANGSRIDGSAQTPVQDAIKNYLKNLPFNGIYVPEYHIDAVQQVDGVVIAELISVETQYGSLPFTQVNTQYTPDAGYMRFDDESDLTITFIAQSPIK